MNVRLAVAALLASGLAAAHHQPGPEDQQTTGERGHRAPAADPTPLPSALPTLRIGDVVPADLALPDLDGDRRAFGDLRGHPVVLHSWSSTCPWELVAEPKLNAIARDYRDRDVAVLGLAANAREVGREPAPAAFRAAPADRPYGNLRQKAAASELNHPILVDHGARLARALGARTTPEVFVFDRDGRLAYRGALDDDGRGLDPTRAGNHVRNALDAVLEGRPVAQPETPPYGGPTRFGDIDATVGSAPRVSAR